jgi:hypothetical protein
MKKIFLACIFIYLIIPGYSQTQVEKGFELQEVLKIAEMYKNVPNLSFTINYSYADSAHSSDTLEKMTGLSRVSDGRYYTSLDSAEYIQGYQYNLAVFHKDSAIVVNDRQDYADLMKLPLLDSVFHSAYVDSMKIVATDDVPINTLYVYLSPSSPYSGYYLVYFRNSYRINNIFFKMKNAPIGEDSTGIKTGTALVNINLSAYSTASVPQDSFWEDKFIYKEAGEIKRKPAYATYQLLDNTTTKATTPN